MSAKSIGKDEGHREDLTTTSASGYYSTREIKHLPTAELKTKPSNIVFQLLQHLCYYLDIDNKKNCQPLKNKAHLKSS
jgi:hypothetical protein